MKGAVSTIVLVLIAVVVVGAIGYNFYAQKPSVPANPSTTLTARECQSKLLSYCNTWSSNGYGRDAVTTGNRPGPWDSFASGCSRLGVTPTADICDRSLRTSGITGRASAINAGFLEQCNPRINNCASGLSCKVGRDNTYRCLR